MDEHVNNKMYLISFSSFMKEKVAIEDDDSKMSHAVFDTDVYRIRITNVSGVKLRAVYGTGSGATSDPYVIFNFASYKFKTNSISKNLNPVWDFEHSFTFTASLNDVLSEMHMIVECWDHNAVFRDVLIGSAKTDLATIFTGPVVQEFKLHHESFADNGALIFSIEVQLIRPVRYRLINIKVRWDTPKVNEYSLKACHSRIGDLGKNGDKIKSEAPEWRNIGTFVTEEPLATINSTHICYLIYKENDTSASSGTPSKELIGKTQVNIGKYFTYSVTSSMNFQEPIVNRRAKVGTLEGNIVVENVGLIAQMPNGKNTNNGVVGGTPRHPNLPVPMSYRREYEKKEIILGLKATNLGLTLTEGEIAHAPQRNLIMTSINPEATGYGLLGDPSEWDEPVLPPGWIRLFDPKTRQYYYENKSTKERRTTPPS